MSKEAKSGEVEKEFRPPFNRVVGGMLRLTDGGMYLTATMDVDDADKGVTLLVARVDAEGNADANFGADGVASTQVQMRSSSAFPMGVIRGSDGRVTAAVVVNRTIGLARFTAEGDLDSTFGDSGTITHILDPLTSRPSGESSSEVSYAYGMARSDAMSNGAFRAVGAMHGGIVPAPGGGAYFVRDMGFGGAGWSHLVRFTSNGRLDKSFGYGGAVRVQHPAYGTTVLLAVSHDMNADEGSRVVVAGWVGTFTNTKACVARYDKSGRLDADFGDEGFAVVESPQGTSNTLFGAVHVTRDGNIFVSGWSNEGERQAAILVGLDATGKPLLSFNQGQPVRLDLLEPDTKYDFRTSVAVQTDGKIVVVGQATNSKARTVDILVARYLPDGSLDRNFGAPNGWTKINPFGRTDNWVLTSEFAPDGKIILAGGSFDSTAGWVVRLSS